jgi:hypothetical protein
MLPWFLMIASALLAYLAYDAARLSTPADSVPYSQTAKGLGQDVTHVPLTEQHRLKRWNSAFGLGDLAGTVWLFGILSVGALAAAVLAFFRV